MLKIQENQISLTRGDTAYLDFGIFNERGNLYKGHEGDKVVFTVKRNIYDKQCAFKKEFDVGEPITIFPEDTENLAYGRYWYDIQLTTSLGEVFTVIEKTRFCLREDVSE